MTDTAIGRINQSDPVVNPLSKRRRKDGNLRKMVLLVLCHVQFELTQRSAMQQAKQVARFPLSHCSGAI